MQADAFQNRFARRPAEFMRRPLAILELNRGVVASVNEGNGHANERRFV